MQTEIPKNCLQVATTKLGKREQQEFRLGFLDAAGPEFDEDHYEGFGDYCRPWMRQTVDDETFDEEEGTPFTLLPDGIIMVNAAIHATAYELGKAWWKQLVTDGVFDKEGNYTGDEEAQHNVLTDLIERAGMDLKSQGTAACVVPNKDEDGLWRLNDDWEEIKGTFDGLCKWLRSLPENCGHDMFWEKAPTPEELGLQDE